MISTHLSILLLLQAPEVWSVIHGKTRVHPIPPVEHPRDLALPEASSTAECCANRYAREFGYQTSLDSFDGSCESQVQHVADCGHFGSARCICPETHPLCSSAGVWSSPIDGGSWTYKTKAECTDKNGQTRSISTDQYDKSYGTSDMRLSDRIIPVHRDSTSSKLSPKRRLREPVEIDCEFTTRPNGKFYDAKQWKRHGMSMGLFEYDTKAKMSRLVAPSYSSHGVNAWTVRRATEVTLLCVLSGDLPGVLSLLVRPLKALPSGLLPVYPLWYFDATKQGRGLRPSSHLEHNFVTVPAQETDPPAQEFQINGIRLKEGEWYDLEKIAGIKVGDDLFRNSKLSARADLNKG